MDENNQEKDVKIVDAVIEDDNNQAGEKLNPWFSMINKPTATIEQILNNNPRKQVLLVSALGGFLGGINVFFSSQQISMNWRIGILIFGPLSGIFFLYLNGLIYRLAGHLLKGEGTPETIRAAAAWSTVPGIWGTILCILMTPLSSFGFGVLLTSIQTFLSLWGIVLVSITLAKAQNFKSPWMGFANILLAILIVSVLTLFIIIISSAIAFGVK